ASRQRVPSTMPAGYAGREWSVPRRCIGRNARLVGMPGGEPRTCPGGGPAAVHGTAASQQRISCQEQRFIEALGDRRWATDGDMEEAARRSPGLPGNLGKERRWARKTLPRPMRASQATELSQHLGQANVT
ncbi:MAG: hypothetical protein LKE27_04410, partial [Atopobiaceae bacterium]|nr:hypothetical protein [Atopobiaceae bacterium]